MTRSEDKLKHFEDFTKWPMLALAISIIPLIVFQMRISPLSPWAGLLDWLDLLVWALFAAEFFTRFVLQPGRWWTFVRKNKLDFALVLIPPSMLLNGLSALAGSERLSSGRALRIIRIVRLIKSVGWLMRGLEVAKKSLRDHPFAYVLSVVAFVTVGAGVVVKNIEANHGVGGSHIDSHADAFWWAIYNLSTLGSNDFRATTTWGRGLEIILALLGLGLFGLLAGSLGAFFVEKEERVEIAETQNDYEKIIERLGLIEVALAKLAPASVEPEGASVDEPQDSE